MAHISDIEGERTGGGGLDVRSGPATQRSAARDRGVYAGHLKRLFDLVAVILASPVVLPVVILLAVLIRRDGGPAFFVQDRVGRGGKVFRIWKLRSMVVDAERRLADHLAICPAALSEWRETQKLKNDPRVTPIGRFLRRTSLDELPQLWNVLRGDMSLVGPRPMLPDQRALYPGTAYYRLRPGITGPWQVSDRNGSAFANRAFYDSDYADRLSLATDLMVLLRTVRAVLRGTGY